MGKISAQPHTTLCIQFLDRENNDKNNTLPLGKQSCFTIVWGCAEILPIYEMYPLIFFSPSACFLSVLNIHVVIEMFHIHSSKAWGKFFLFFWNILHELQTYTSQRLVIVQIRKTTTTKRNFTFFFIAESMEQFQLALKTHADAVTLFSSRAPLLDPSVTKMLPWRADLRLREILWSLSISIRDWEMSVNNTRCN